MNEKKRQIAISAFSLSIVGSLILALLKFAAGYWGDSYALIADGIESSTDVLSSFIIFWGLSMSMRPADNNHPYGHGKIEPLMSIVVVLFLLGSAVTIFYHGINNIRTDHRLPAAWTLWILGAIIIWKEVAFHLIIRKAQQTNSGALRAEAWHQRSDTITSVAAFIGITVAITMGEGYENADDWAALCAALMILYNSYLIFRPALAELLDEHLYHDLIDEIREKSLQVNGIIATEKCWVRKSGMFYQVDLHIIVDGDMSVRTGHALSHQLKDYLMETLPDIQSVLIHIEPH